LLTDSIIINESLINSDAIKFNEKDLLYYKESLTKEKNDNLPLVSKEKKDDYLLKFTSIFVVQNDYKYRTLKVIKNNY